MGTLHVVLPDLELLRIEIETIWTPDARGRLKGRDLVIASSADGFVAGFGANVPDDVVAVLEAAIAGAPRPESLSSPPAILAYCRQVLEDTLGPLELAAQSGPSYVFPDTIGLRSAVSLVRSDGAENAELREKNPGTWEADEWAQLIDGRLGPWVMATHHGDVVSICHTPAHSARGAEAGVWTRPGFRGQGYAAAVTAEWASLMRPLGRSLFYSTSGTNVASQRVAGRLGLRPLGWLWQLASAGREAAL